MKKPNIIIENLVSGYKPDTNKRKKLISIMEKNVRDNPSDEISSLLLSANARLEKYKNENK